MPRCPSAMSSRSIKSGVNSASKPQIDTAALTHQQLLRSMDALMDHHADVDVLVAGLLRPLVEQDM